MKASPLKFANGEVGELRQLDDGMFACPICGEPWLYPPYCPNDGVLGPIHPVSTPAFGDVCEGCEVEFGVDEGVAASAPIGWMRRQFIGFRIRWLDRVHWSAAAYRQLRDNLGVTEEEVRRDAEQFGGWRGGCGAEGDRDNFW